MKKSLLFLLSTLLIVPLASCGSTGTSSSPLSSSEESSIVSSSEELPVKKEVNAAVPSVFNSEGSEASFNAKATYDESYFLNDATTFMQGLAQLSYLAAVTCSIKESHEGLFNQMGFDNYYYSKSYDQGHKEDGYTVLLSHKKYKTFDLLSVVFFGMDYREEWVSNFDVGTTGNHHGFDTCATNALTEVKEYIDKNYKDVTLKYWVTGYSRGGALTGLFASKIMENASYNANEKNVYAYTFEAPANTLKTNIKNYKNIHNLVNSMDLVPNLFPSEYELVREGIDYDIYSDNLNDYLAEEIPNFAYDMTFTPYPDEDPLYTDYASFVQFVVNQISKISTEGVSISTRELFDQNLAPLAKDVVRFVLRNLTSDKLSTLVAAAKELTMADIFMAISSEENLNLLVLSLLEQAEIEISDEDNKIVADLIHYVYTLLGDSEFMKVVVDAIARKSNYMNCVLAHLLEIPYVLVEHYQESLE